MDTQAWNDGEECDAHEMAWCAYCNPNESSLGNMNDRPRPRSAAKT